MDWLELFGLPLIGACLLLPIAGCSKHAPAPRPAANAGEYVRGRAAMMRQLANYGITNPAVLAAMREVPRHAFIPEEYRHRADPYGDHPCPIGHGQTISQPYIVAYMTEKLALQPNEKVLEIGTGSGYQAAILAHCGVQVCTIEIIPELAHHARAALDAEGFNTVQTRAGDGYLGWPELAPFDAIIVSCAPEEIPPRLVEQLREGGRMILPVGRNMQRLVILRKEVGETVVTEDLSVRFVPMVHGTPTAL